MRLLVIPHHLSSKSGITLAEELQIDAEVRCLTLLNEPWQDGRDP